MDALHFVYSLDVRAATGPAGELARSLGALNKALSTSQKMLAALESNPGAGMGKAAKAAEAAASSVGKFAASSQRAESASARSSTRIGDNAQRMAERAEKAEQRKTAAMEREGAKQAAAAERTAQRIRRAQEMADQQSRRRQYGGADSFAGLLRNTAESRAGNIRSSIASSIIGGPSALAMGAASAVGSGVSWVASAAYDFGKMAVNAQAMRESSVEGFKAIYGTAEIGNDLFNAARTAAKQTKFDTADVVRDYNTIAAAGFRADQIQRIYWTSADIGSARGTGKQQQYLTALAKINASPQAAFGAVQSAALAGPGIGNVFDELGSRLGLKKTLTRKGWMQKFRDGDISGSLALESVIGATNKLYNKGTGEAGEYARAQGDKSWSGVLSNIKNGLGDVLNMKLPEDNAINKLKKILQKIGSTGGLFDEHSPLGKRFSVLVEKLVDDVFKPFGGIGDQAGTVVEKLLTAAEELEVKFRSVMEDISKGIGEAFSDQGAGIYQLAAKIGFELGGGILKGILALLPGSRYSSTVQGSSERAWGNLAGDAYESLIAPGTIIGGAYDFLGGSRPVGEFASGGIIPGAYGSPQLAIMHGGEVVPGLNGEHMATAQAVYGSGGGTNVFNFHGYNMDELEQAVGRVLTMSVRSPSAATTP